MNPTRILLVVVVLVTLAGCKVVIRSPSTGAVTTSSGNYTCASGVTCEIDINTTEFYEKFQAEPSPGYEFIRWKKEFRYLCGNKSGTCEIDMRPLASLEDVAELLSSDFTLFLEPVFSEVAPII